MASPYLTAAQVRARRSQLLDAATYTDAEIEDLVSEFEEIAERFRGVAFTPRAHTETFTYPAQKVILSRQPVRSVTSFTVNGVAGTVANLTTDLAVGAVWDGGWYGSETLSITYSYGLDAPPAVALRACAEYVRATAVADRSGTGRDVIAQTFDGGFTRYSTPDFTNGRPTGFLEVDRLLSSLPDYRLTGIG